MYSQQPPQPPPMPPQPLGTPQMPPLGAQMPWQTAQGPRRSGFAIAALICSLVGLIPCTCGVVSLTSIVLGAVGLGSVSRSRGQKTGKGMALAGLLIGIIGIPWTFGILYLGYQATFGKTIEAVNPVAEKYLTLISQGKYDEAYEMTSSNFKEATSLEDFKRRNEEIRKLDGEYKSMEVRLLGGGMSIKSDSSGTTAVITYSVNYTKRDNVGRTLTFRKHGDIWLIEGDKTE
jgi:hypothetical protein